MDEHLKAGSERVTFHTAHAFIDVSNGYFLSIGLTCLTLQSIDYLFKGVWHSFTLLSVLKMLEIEWATNPHVWLGLHRTLADCQLYLVLIISGLIGIFYTLAICLAAGINPDALLIPRKRKE